MIFSYLIDLKQLMNPKRENGKILVADLIKKKHSEYVLKSKIYSFFYYTTRLVGGLSAGVIPFTITSNPTLTQVLSILIVVLTVIDLVINPKDKWALFSKATDLLTIAQLKKQDDYENNKEILDTILKTETANLERVIDLKDLVQTLHSINKQP